MNEQDIQEQLESRQLESNDNVINLYKDVILRINDYSCDFNFEDACRDGFDRGVLDSLFQIESDNDI